MRCPICQKGGVKLFGKSYFPNFIYCKNCAGHFLEREHKVLYPKSYFEENGKKSLIAKIAAPFLDFFYFLRVVRIKEIVGKKARILDYGAGSGKLVNLLKVEGYQSFGFEPSVGASVVAKKKGIYLAKNLSSLKGRFDLIMFWHSLEHLVLPAEVLTKAKKLLTKGGRILIAVPNADSFEARLFRQKWFHYTYPLHKIQFTPASLEKMLKTVGFKIKTIDYVNPEYTFSGLVQSFLNLFLPENALYGVVSHRRINKSRSLATRFAMVSVLLVIVFSPAIAIFYFLELIFKKSGAIVLVSSK